MKKILLLFVLVLPALGQRYDNFSSTVASASGIGNLMQAVPNATITVCNFPGTGGTPCTNKATTYTSQTLVTPCAAATQVVLQGSSTCQATGDTIGNFGFWAPATKYTVCIGGTNVTTVCGTVTATVDALSNSNPGVFTNTQMNEYLTSVINSCNTHTQQVADPFRGSNVTNAISGCVIQPSSSTVVANAVYGMAQANVTSGSNANGGSFGAQANGNDSVVQGVAADVWDTTNAGFTNMELLGGGFGVATTNGSANTVYELLDGVAITAFFANQPAKFWNGNSIQPIGNGVRCGTANTNQWNNCVTSFDGAATLFTNIGTTSSASGASDSQPIQGSARASGTADTNAQIIFVHAAPSGSCPALATVAINVAATTNSTVLYTCANGTTWAAVTVP